MRVVLGLVFLLQLAGCALFGNNTLDKELAAQNREREARTASIRQLKQHYELGENYYSKDQLELAQEQFEAMLKISADEESALYRLGNIAFRKKEITKSAEYFERVVTKNPRNQKAQFNLASIRLMQAENHFKYYAALVGKETDLSKVTELLGDIDSFASRDSAPDKSQSLDRIAGALKK